MKLTATTDQKWIGLQPYPQPVRLTLLDIPLFEYRDHEWQPRGDKVHNGYRQHVKGFRT